MLGPPGGLASPRGRLSGLGVAGRPSCPSQSSLPASRLRPARGCAGHGWAKKTGAFKAAPAVPVWWFWPACPSRTFTRLVRRGVECRLVKGTAPAQRSWRRLHSTAETSGATNKQTKGKNQRPLGGFPVSPPQMQRHRFGRWLGSGSQLRSVVAKEGRPGAWRQPGGGAGCKPSRVRPGEASGGV